jgi:hypothetical protein
MGYPVITDDQREMAIVLLANALRKDAHLRDRAGSSDEPGSILHAGLRKRRLEPSQRYLDGMHDLLRVLFHGGESLVAECLEEAYARAVGAPATTSSNGDGPKYH